MSAEMRERCTPGLGEKTPLKDMVFDLDYMHWQAERLSNLGSANEEFFSRFLHLTDFEVTLCLSFCARIRERRREIVCACMRVLISLTELCFMSRLLFSSHWQLYNFHPIGKTIQRLRRPLPAHLVGSVRQEWHLHQPTKRGLFVCMRSWIRRHLLSFEYVATV